MSTLRKVLVVLAVITLAGSGIGFAASLDVQTQKIAVAGSAVNVPKQGVSVTQVAAGGAVNTARTTTATVSGGTASTTADLTFTLYGPGTGCTGTTVGNPQTIASTGADGDAYTSAARTPTVAGTYWWHVSFAGDATNNAASSCVSIAVTSASAPSTKLRLASITLVGGNRSGNSQVWQAHITVKVVDESGNGVSDVSVTGIWSGVNSSENGCSTLTSAAGTCTFQANFNGGGGATDSPRTWTVSGLSRSGFAYDSANNAVNKITCSRSAVDSGATTCSAAVK
jgi:hypothetical protein